MEAISFLIVRHYLLLPHGRLITVRCYFGDYLLAKCSHLLIFNLQPLLHFSCRPRRLSDFGIYLFRAEFFGIDSRKALAPCCQSRALQLSASIRLENGGIVRGISLALLRHVANQVLSEFRVCVGVHYLSRSFHCGGYEQSGRNYLNYAPILNNRFIAHGIYLTYCLS